MKLNVQDASVPASFTPVDFDPFADTTEPISFPLTGGQWEIWASTQMDQEASCAYNQCYPVRMTGKLVVDAMRNAILMLIARHEALRTVFGSQGESQIVIESLVIDIPLVDLTSLGETERKDTIAAYLYQETQRPFDLVQGPLFRAQIIKEAQDCHLVIMTAHHIVCDGWSAGILLKDLTSLYDADSFGVRAQLADAGRFSDFARYQVSTEYQNQAKASEQYWRTQFADVVPVLDLPLDRPRPPIRTYKCDQQHLSLGEVLSRNLRRIAAKHGCTLHTLLLAGCQALIYRLTGQSDFVVGLFAAGQALVDGNALVGHGTNLLPLRTTINPEAPFSTHLRDTRGKMLDALEHQAATFGSLVQVLNLSRDPSRAPLVAVTFNIDRVEVEFPFQSLASELLPSPKRFATFEIEFNILDTGSDLIVECNHNLDLFSPESITRWLQYYQVLLTGMVENPDQSLGKLPLLTEKEHTQTLELWNATARPFPHERCIHDLVEAQSVRSPDAVAVVCGEQRITYSELNRWAQRLASYLQSLGVGPEVLVGISAERSIEMVVGMLAVLKAGGAYVPLDPSFPHDRLQFMVEDAGVSVLLTTEESNNLAAQVAHLVNISNPQLKVELGARFAESKPLSKVTTENLAYVIYTSGSTGRPKGVQITHRSVVNFLESMKKEPGLSSRDVLLSVTTLSFDIAALEIFLPLIVGAQLDVVSREVATDAEKLKERLMTSKVTTMQATPATWRMLIEAGWSGSPQLKILCGGEALSAELGMRLRQCGAEVWNLYGPTETTIWSALHHVQEERGQIPIGRPIANTQLYILDRLGQPVPIGVSGELYIGGIGLARGYLNRPELTEEKFIPDPFSNQSGARLYRTGDLARYLPDGNIEFLGRLDYQVKVRGYRIELGEITAVLATHPAVRDCIVVVREDKKDDKQLVAYVVGGREATPPVSELRAFLKTQLPDYMVPTAFMWLEAMPTTPNGKVDRRALPVPQRTPTALEDASSAPRTLWEQLLAETWQEVLGVQPGVYDNFFDLGGHSLLCVQVTNRIAKRTGVQLKLSDLMFQTLGQLASACEARQSIPKTLSVSFTDKMRQGLKSLFSRKAGQEL